MRVPALLVCLLLAPPGFGDDGEALYGQYCQGCHGLDAAGLAEFDGDADAFARVLEGESVDEMPDFYGVFSDAEIASLLDFVQAAPQ